MAGRHSVTLILAALLSGLMTVVASSPAFALRKLLIRR